MAKFEYKTVLIELDEKVETVLNAYGQEGWDLAHLVPKINPRYAVAIFKRAVKGK